MASMGDMPNVSRNIMSFCSGHGLYNNGFLGLKKRIIGRIQGFDSALFISLSRTCRGPTPNDREQYDSFSRQDRKDQQDGWSLHFRTQ